MSSAELTPLRKGKRKSAPLDVGVASTSKKTRTSLQSAAISESAVNGNAVSGRKRKSLGKLSINEDSDNLSSKRRSKSGLSSEDPLTESVQESDSSSSVFQPPVTISASKTRGSISRSSSNSDLSQVTPRKTVRRTSASTPLLGATPSRRGRPSNLQPIIESAPVPPAPLPAVSVTSTMPVGESSQTSASTVNPAPAPVPAPAPFILDLPFAPMTSASDEMIPGRIVFKDTWYSWLSALFLVLLVTSSMLSNLGMFPWSMRSSSNLTMSTTPSVQVQNSSGFQVEVQDHFEWKVTVKDVEIMNQSANATEQEVSLIIAKLLAQQAEKMSEYVEVVNENENNQMEEAVYSQIKSTLPTIEERIIAVEEVFFSSTAAFESSEQVAATDMTVEHAQQHVEALAEETRSQDETTIAIEQEILPEVQALNHELSVFAPEEHAATVTGTAETDTEAKEGKDLEAEMEALTTDLQATTIINEESQEAPAVAVDAQHSQPAPSTEAIVKEMVQETVSKVVATSTFLNESDMTRFLQEKDLALSARDTKIDGTHLSLVSSASSSASSTLSPQKKAFIKYIQQPLHRAWANWGAYNRLNSNKPVQRMSDCLAFDYNTHSQNAFVVRLLKAANISSVGITQLISNTTSSKEEDEIKVSGVKDFAIYNMDRFPNMFSYGNMIASTVNDKHFQVLHTFKEEVPGGLLVKQIYPLPKAVTVKNLGFKVLSLQKIGSSLGCLCRAHVFGDFVKVQDDEEFPLE